MRPVIVVTRLNGPKFAVNADLVQRIDSAPDTILTLVDGTKYIVVESMEEVISLIVDFRARLITRAQQAQDERDPASAPGPSLTVVRDRSVEPSPERPASPQEEQ